MILTASLNVSGQQNDEINIIDQNYKGEYLGLNFPDTIPKVFAPGFISGKGRLHCFPTFSIDNKEIYWLILPPKIMTIREIDGKWTDPQIASFSTGGNNLAPFVAHDSMIYFSSSREGGQGRQDIWYTTKTDSNYTVPVNIGDKINTDKLETNPTVSKNKTIYYTGSVQIGKILTRNYVTYTYHSKTKMENGVSP